MLFRSSIFGNEIIYNSKDRYDYLFIRDNGKEFPLSYNALLHYINNNVLTSKEIVDQFGFSRQYLNSLKKENNILSLNNGLYILNSIKLFKK